VGARLAPMVLLAGLAAAVTVYFEQQPYTRSFAGEERLLLAANAAWFYMHTFLAPVGLSPVYPEWRVVPSDPSWWAAAGLCLAMAAALFAAWRRIAPLALWGILHFFVALMPVLGLVSFNYQTYTAVADHFLYLPCIGGALALAIGAEALVSRAPASWAPRQSLAVLGVLVLGVAAVQSGREATHWRTNLAFWTRVHERDPDGFLGNFNLGNHYRYRGEWAEAVPHYRRAAEIRPLVDYPFRRYVQALRNSRGPEDALAACNEKLRRAPDFAPAYLERAITYEQMGREAEAARDYAEARRLAPRGTP
jgi:tetratricopeptide (TPR) repeat protein